MLSIEARRKEYGQSPEAKLKAKEYYRNRRNLKKENDELFKMDI